MKELLFSGGVFVFSSSLSIGDSLKEIKDAFLNVVRVAKVTEKPKELGGGAKTKEDPTPKTSSPKKIYSSASLNFSSRTISARTTEEALNIAWNNYSREFLDYLKNTRNTYAGKVTHYGGKLIYLDESDLWAKMVKERFNSSDVSYFQNICKKHLNQIPNSPANFQTFIRACTASLTIKQRALDLKLKVLESSSTPQKLLVDTDSPNQKITINKPCEYFGATEYFFNSYQEAVGNGYLSKCVEGSPKRYYWANK